MDDMKRYASHFSIILFILGLCLVLLTTTQEVGPQGLQGERGLQGIQGDPSTLAIMANNSPGIISPVNFFSTKCVVTTCLDRTFTVIGSNTILVPLTFTLLGTTVSCIIPEINLNFTGEDKGGLLTSIYLVTKPSAFGFTETVQQLPLNMRSVGYMAPLYSKANFRTTNQTTPQDNQIVIDVQSSNIFIQDASATNSEVSYIYQGSIKTYPMVITWSVL